MTEPSATHQSAPASGELLRVPVPAPANSHDSAPSHPLGELHHALGNLGVLSRLASPGVQPKLEVGAPDDEHEREADAVAAAVMRRPKGEDSRLPSTPQTLRRAPEDEKKHDTKPAASPPEPASAPKAASAASPAPATGATKSAPPPIPVKGGAGAAPVKSAPPTKKSPSHTGAKDAGTPATGAAAKSGAAGKAPGLAKPAAAARPPKPAVASQPPARADPHGNAAHDPPAKQPGKHPDVARDRPKPAAHTQKPTEKPKTGTTVAEHPPGQAPPSPHRSGGPPKLIGEPVSPASASQTAQAPTAGERKPEEPVVAAKPATPGAVPAVSPSAARTIRSAQGGGQPLAAGERNFYESRLGRDLSAVRVHDNAAAHRAARDIQARAFTYGRDIFFAAGRRQPGTGAGRELMAHELAHTIQQRPGAKLDRKVQRDPDPQPQSQPQSAGGPAGVVRDPGSWTLTFPQLEVPGFRLSAGGGKYAGALTRPKGYDRKKAAPKPQRDVWIGDAQGEVEKRVPAVLQGIGATLHDGRYFVHQLGKGMPERFYIGDEGALAGDLTTPEWDAAGKGHGFRGFEVDHVLELQLGGTNTPDNLELLDRKINGASGLFIMQSIDNTVRDYLAALPASERDDPALKLSDWRANWNLTFQKAVPPQKGAPPEPSDNDRWTREQIKQGVHFKPAGVLAEANPDKLGSKSEVKLFPSGSGGVMTTLRPAEGAAGVKFFKPFKATAANYFVEDTTAPELAAFTFALDGAKGLKLDEPPTITAQRLPGMKFAGSVDRAAARRSLGKLGAARFSPIDLDVVDLGPNGVYAEGQIVSDLPIVSGTPIDLVLDGPKLTISHTFELGDFKLPAPLKVTQSTLSVSATSDGEIAANGRVDAEIEKLGRGFLAARAGAREGLALEGGFDFSSQVFDKAHVGFAYHDGQYSGEGELTLNAGKITGLKGGSAHAKYENDHFDLKGHADFDIPGIKQADIELTYDPVQGTTLTAAPQLDSLPGIKSGAALSITVKEPPGGGAAKLSGHGEAEPDIPGISAKLAVSYDDGAFLAQVDVPFQAGLINGKITAGATNQPVGEDGLPLPAAAGAHGEVRIFGGGMGTVAIAPWLSGTAAIRLLANGEVEVHGELAVPAANLYEGKDLIDRDIVPMIHTDVPIFPPVVLGLGAGLKLKVGYGPGVLSGSIGITYNPSHADQTKLHGGLHLHASAHAGIELYTQVGLGLGITGASITGNIQLGGELALEANLDDTATIDWSPDQGLVLDNTVRATAEPQLVITLRASVLGTLGPFSHELWSEDLGSVRYGSGLNFALTWPLHYEEHKPFAPSVDDIKVDAPPIEPLRVAKGILQQFGGDDS